MNCPQCSTPITDPQAVFCLRCGTRLPPSLTPQKVGWEPVPHTSANMTPTGLARPNAYGVTGIRVSKVVVSALLGAVLLTWFAWVTNYLQNLPTKSEAVYHAMQDPHNVEDLEGFGNELGRDSLNAALPFGIIVGLAVGTGVGLLITRPKTVDD